VCQNYSVLDETWGSHSGEDVVSGPVIGCDTIWNSRWGPTQKTMVSVLDEITEWQHSTHKDMLIYYSNHTAEHTFIPCNIEGENVYYIYFSNPLFVILHISLTIILFSAGFSNCDMHITSGTPATVQWYMGLGKKLQNLIKLFLI
jgi:hypothetical protein